MRRTRSLVLLAAGLAVLAGCGRPTVTPTPTVTSAPPETLLASATTSPTASLTLLATEQPSGASTWTPTAESALVCDVLPQEGFIGIWQSDPELQMALGCSTSNHPRIPPEAWEVSTSYQPFERGFMIWSNQIGWYPQPVIHVVYEDRAYQRFDDTYDPAVDPSGGGETPPEGLVGPVLGFGKVWREDGGVRAGLGWATAPETPGSGRFQLFEGGDMIWLSQTDRTYVFVVSTGEAREFDVPFSSVP